jgi:hypothetical protein
MTPQMMAKIFKRLKRLLSSKLSESEMDYLPPDLMRIGIRARTEILGMLEDQERKQYSEMLAKGKELEADKFAYEAIRRKNDSADDA